MTFSFPADCRRENFTRCHRHHSNTSNSSWSPEWRNIFRSRNVFAMKICEPIGSRSLRRSTSKRLSSTPNDIYTLTEGMLAAIFKAAREIDIPMPFPRLTYLRSRRYLWQRQAGSPFWHATGRSPRCFSRRASSRFSGARSERRRGQGDQRQKFRRHHHRPGR